jgi:hypothetical protein
MEDFRKNTFVSQSSKIRRSMNILHFKLKKRTFVQDERFSHKMYNSRFIPTLRRGLD